MNKWIIIGTIKAHWFPAGSILLFGKTEISFYFWSKTAREINEKKTGEEAHAKIEQNSTSLWSSLPIGLLRIQSIDDVDKTHNIMCWIRYPEWVVIICSCWFVIITITTIILATGMNHSFRWEGDKREIRVLWLFYQSCIHTSYLDTRTVWDSIVLLCWQPSIWISDGG